MASAASSDISEDGVTSGGITSSPNDNTSAGIALTTSTVSVESASGSSELAPDAAALEAAMDAAADASLRIYLVRQDAEAAAMIDEARAAGDALFATKLKENAEAAAAAALPEDDATSDSIYSEKNSPIMSPGMSDAQLFNKLTSAAVSEDPISSDGLAEGCPEPWESNPKFSPCRKFMAEFCTLHGIDPRSRCSAIVANYLCVFLMRCFVGMSLCGGEKVKTMSLPDSASERSSDGFLRFLKSIFAWLFTCGI
jgi:hypothetical protein